MTGPPPQTRVVPGQLQACRTPPCLLVSAAPSPQMTDREREKRKKDQQSVSDGEILTRSGEEGKREGERGSGCLKDHDNREIRHILRHTKKEMKVKITEDDSFQFH